MSRIVWRSEGAEFISSHLIWVTETTYTNARSAQIGIIDQSTDRNTVTALLA